MRTPKLLLSSSIALGLAATSGCFVVDDASLAPAADLVASVTRTRYPDLAIPYHSRWRHFEAGGIDRRSHVDPLAVRNRVGSEQVLLDSRLVDPEVDAGAGAVPAEDDVVHAERLEQIGDDRAQPMPCRARQPHAGKIGQRKGFARLAQGRINAG